MTLFEQCVEAAESGDVPGCDSFPAITRRVIQCLIDNTESPRTCDELTRVLGEAGVVIDATDGVL